MMTLAVVIARQKRTFGNIDPDLRTHLSWPFFETDNALISIVDCKRLFVRLTPGKTRQEENFGVSRQFL
jgi:hypothetical protein